MSTGSRSPAMKPATASQQPASYTPAETSISNPRLQGSGMMRYHEALWTTRCGKRNLSHAQHHETHLGTTDRRSTLVMSDSHPTRPSHRLLATITALAVFVGGALMLTQGGPLGDNNLLAQAANSGQKKSATENPFPNRPPAPSFDGGTGWIARCPRP